MNKRILLFILGMFFTMSFAEDSKKESSDDFTLSPHHGKLKLECKICHGDGDEDSYEPLTTVDCLSCHNSIEKIAKRTAFLDANEVNPHNSTHLESEVGCDTCHLEHEPNEFFCTDCHEKDEKNWPNKAPYSEGEEK